MENLEITSPARRVSRKPARFRLGRSLLAVAVGVVTDLGGTNIVEACYALVVFIPMVQSLAATGLSQSEMQAELTQRLQQAVSGSILLIVLGILMSVLGGYFAGRIAGYAEVVHGLAVGFGVTLVSVTVTLVFRLPTGTGSDWQLLVGLIINWVSPMLGGYLAQLQRGRSSRKLAVAIKGVG